MRNFKVAILFFMVSLAVQAQTVLLNGVTITASAITDNSSVVQLYSSGAIITNPYEGLEFSIRYHDQLPAFVDGQPLPYHNIWLVVEKKISTGVWVSMVTQTNRFVKEENDNVYTFQFDPSVINFDEGQPQYLGDGTLSYKVRGRLPNDIRFRILATDYKYGEPGAFQSVTVELSYELYNL